MAKINTTNYQPVSAWNGTQDLLIVEQPDGTKVATPEQVKQYVEAGDFEATGEIIDGHGNILDNIADTDEFTIELPSGWTKPGKSPYTLQFIKRGKIVCVYCTGVYTGSINQSVNVGTLPTKFKPFTRTEIKIMNLIVAPITDYNPAVSFSFLADGRIIIYSYGKTNADLNIGSYIGSYPVA